MNLGSRDGYGGGGWPFGDDRTRGATRGTGGGLLPSQNVTYTGVETPAPSTSPPPASGYAPSPGMTDPLLQDWFTPSAGEWQRRGAAIAGQPPWFGSMDLMRGMRGGMRSQSPLAQLGRGHRGLAQWMSRQGGGGGDGKNVYGGGHHVGAPKYTADNYAAWRGYQGAAPRPPQIPGQQAQMQQMYGPDMPWWQWPFVSY